MNAWVIALEWVILGYFAALHGGYLGLNLVSLYQIGQTISARVRGPGHLYSGLEPPVSIIVPAFNEAGTIAATVHSLLQLDYPDFEVVLVNDGSEDDTLSALHSDLDLTPFPEAYRVQLETGPVKAVYRSNQHPGVRVVDKENGGKSDALNAGINAARYPLFCVVDSDSILQRNSLRQIVRPFLEDSRTVAAGGTVRVANGCRVTEGFLDRVGLPRNLLALVQVMEYLRAFLFGRMGWSAFNGLLIISGAFGAFHRETVISVGGYRTDTVGEDMELCCRIQHRLRQQRRPLRLAFVPDPVCWSEVPESLGSLKSQRIRWQRGLGESLVMNGGLLFHPRGGSAGWLAMPFMVIFEWLGPLLEVAGYAVMIAGFFLGWISQDAFLAFLLLALGLGILLSLSALLLEELSFRVYRQFHAFPLLIMALLLENLGYRQLNSLWRCAGLVGFLVGGKASWGGIQRSGRWQVGGGPE